MKSIFGLLLIFAIAIVVLSILRSAGASANSSKAFQFARRDPFLRQDEIYLYKRLTNALIDAHIFPQVAMSAFVQHKGKVQAARNMFAQKYVDFVVCDRETMRLLYVIELDGASHNSAKAQKRDRQKNDVLASAGIPIMRYTSQNVDLRNILRDFESVKSPRPVEGTGVPRAARKSNPSTVQTPST